MRINKIQCPEGRLETPTEKSINVDPFITGIVLGKHFNPQVISEIIICGQDSGRAFSKPNFAEVNSGSAFGKIWGCGMFSASVKY